MKIFSLFFISCILLFSCNPINKITFSAHQAFDENELSDDLRLAFNGTASFYIQHKDRAVFTDPFMTNPSMKKVLFGKLQPDTSLLDSYQPKIKDVKMVAVGHAHYDHILDFPYFVDKLNNETVVLGSENVVKQVQTLNTPFELVNAGEIKANLFKAGTWVYAHVNSVRMMPIKSAHLPHIFGLHLYEGAYEEDTLASFPVKGKKFKQDETLAYLIDFLDENLKPEKRIYFSSSAVASINGLIPLEVLNEKEVDVAILSVALVQNAKGYPESIVKYIKPKEVIFCHWENFFRDRNKKLKPISLTSFKEIFRDAKTLENYTKVHFVKPGNSIVFVE